MAPARVGAAVVLAALLAPATAAAHGRGPTVALDYRLVLDSTAASLPGVHVRVLDGDRDLQVRVDPGVALVLLGAIHEPFLRLDPTGVWANAASPTARADRIVSSGTGWVRIATGDTIAWHDHRLSPPPVSKPGPAGSFAVPVELHGRPGLIHGTFYRVARPAVWPWLVAAAALLLGVAAAVRRRSLRGPVTIGLGALAGVCALVAVTTFAVRDAPTGGVAWLQIATAAVVSAGLALLLLRLRGRARVHAAGVVGAVAAAVSLGSLSVFWHGAVISALAPTLVRLACGLALVGGAASVALSFLPDFDEPVRGPARR